MCINVPYNIIISITTTLYFIVCEWIKKCPKMVFSDATKEKCSLYIVWSSADYNIIVLGTTEWLYNIGDCIYIP